MACLKKTSTNPVQTATPSAPIPPASDASPAALTIDAPLIGHDPIVLDAPFVDPWVPVPSASDAPIVKTGSSYWGNDIPPNPDLPVKTESARIYIPTDPAIPTPPATPNPPQADTPWLALVGYWLTPSGDVRAMLPDGTIRIVYNYDTPSESMSGPWVTLAGISGSLATFADGERYHFYASGPTRVYWPAFGEDWQKLANLSPVATASAMPDFAYPTPTRQTDPILFPDDPLIGDAHLVEDLPEQHNPDVADNWQTGEECPPDTYVESSPVTFDSNDGESIQLM